jgi:uncharacterized protein DUF6249
MAQTSDNFVAIIAIMVIFGMPLAYAISHRWWSHQERLEMIKRGMTPPSPPPDPRAARRAQRAGYDPFAYSQMHQPYVMGDQPPQYPDRVLRKGVTVAMVGLALLIGLSFISPGHPGPWLLGGLIPLFVGLAQIILALMSGAHLGVFTFQGPPPVQPHTAAPPPPPPYQEGPYGWRPGPTTELEPPVGPPDVRP